MSKKITTKSTTKEKAAPRPAYIRDEEIETPQGDQIFPAIGIIQGLSPQKDPDSPSFIEDCQEGQLFNSATKELFDGDDGVKVIPLLVTKQYVEWVPRKQGGGLVATYETAEEAKQRATPGNEIRVSINYFVQLVDGTVAVIRLATPTKMKVHRKWAALIEDSRTMNGRVYRLGVVREKNKVGQVYYNYSVAVDGWATKEQYQEGTKLIQSVVESQKAIGQRAGADQSEM